MGFYPALFPITLYHYPRALVFFCLSLSHFFLSPSPSSPSPKGCGVDVGGGGGVGWMWGVGGREFRVRAD